MARIGFTEKKIQSATSGGKEQAFLWDREAPHLGLRVTEAGAKAFIFQSRIAGRAFRMTIGSPDSWSIDEARIEARKYQTLVDQGIDPRQEKKDRIMEIKATRREAARKDIKVKEAWESYIEASKAKWGEHHLADHLKMMKKGGTPYKHEKDEGKKSRVSKPGILTPFGNLRLHELSQDIVIDWLKKEAPARPTQTALAFRLLRGFANWCAEEERYEGLIPPESTHSKKVRNLVPKPKAKDDILQKNQLAAWFREVNKLNPVVSAYLQVVLLTGARREEILMLRWEDVSFKWATVSISDKVTGRRQIPLTPYVNYLIHGLPRVNEWVFSSTTAKDGHLVEPTKAHIKAQIAGGLNHVTIHGLRRSFGSLSEWLEMPLGIVYQIMGHKPSATAEKHYRHRPIDLLKIWHTKFETWILEQANIQPPALPKNSVAFRVIP